MADNKEPGFMDKTVRQNLSDLKSAAGAAKNASNYGIPTIPGRQREKFMEQAQKDVAAKNKPDLSPNYAMRQALANDDTSTARSLVGMKDPIPRYQPSVDLSRKLQPAHEEVRPLDSFRKGGSAKKSGPYRLHKGERATGRSSGRR